VPVNDPRVLKNLYILFLLFSSFILPHLFLYAEESISKPTALISALFWQKYSNKTLIYWPWGNEEENNSTNLELKVGSNGLSKKFAYYGQKNLNFYEKKYFSPREISLMSEKEKELMNETPLVAEFPFSAKQDEIQEFILLFIKDSQTGRFKIYPLPFSKQRIPFGSYHFISQAREELNFTINQDRMSLGPGEKNFQDFSKLTNTPMIQVTGYRREDNEYKKFYSQNFSNNKNRRGYLFFSPDRKRIKVTLLMENDDPIESVLGYGIERVKKEEKEEIEDKTPLASPTSIIP